MPVGVKDMIDTADMVTGTGDGLRKPGASHPVGGNAARSRSGDALG